MMVWTSKHTIFASIVVGLLVLAGLAGAGWEYWNTKEESRLQAIYGTVDHEVDQLQGKTPTEEQKKSWEEKLMSIIQQGPRTSAAQMSALRLMDLKLQADPTATLEKVQHGSSVLSGLVRLALGNQQADHGDCAAAIENWARILKVEKFAFIHREAQLRQALCYTALKQVDKAKEIYEKLIADNEAGVYQRQAQKLVRSVSGRL